MTENEQRTRRIEGCLLGTAAGDALGLPAEGLTPQRQLKLYPRMDRYQLLGGRGIISDDTEHAVLTLFALERSQGDPERFGRQIRRGLRRWFWTLPPGIGYGTLRAGLRLTLGLKQSGVFSAGNGPAMRAPIIAAWTYPEGKQDLAELVRQSTEATHTDPKAYYGSLVLARLTHQLLDGALDPEGLVHGVNDSACLEIVERVLSRADRTPAELCHELDYRRGVTGYIYHTLAVVLQASLHPGLSFEEALVATVRCGGDSDSTAALVGGILGAVRGAEAIPLSWKTSLRDWPLNGFVLSQLARGAGSEPSYAASLARNLVVGPWLIACALRRLAPPY